MLQGYRGEGLAPHPYVNTATAAEMLVGSGEPTACVIASREAGRFTDWILLKKISRTTRILHPIPGDLLPPGDPGGRGQNQPYFFLFPTPPAPLPCVGAFRHGGAEPDQNRIPSPAGGVSPMRSIWISREISPHPGTVNCSAPYPRKCPASPFGKLSGTVRYGRGNEIIP